MIAKFWIVGLAACLIPCVTVGPAIGGANKDVAPVVIVANVEPLTLAAGGSAVVSLPIEVAEGFHVQANPAGNPFLVPLEVTVESNDVVVATNVAYPPGKPFLMVDDENPTYSGKLRIALTLTAATNAAPNRLVVRGNIRYQACTSNHCLFPANQPFELDVTIKNRRGAR